MITAHYDNGREVVTVIMDGECLGCNRAAHAAVRKTVDNRYAVIATIGRHLLKTFKDENRARAYCISLRGE